MLAALRWLKFCNLCFELFYHFYHTLSLENGLKTMYPVLLMHSLLCLNIFIESGSTSWEWWRLWLLIDIEAIDDKAKTIQPFR